MKKIILLTTIISLSIHSSIASATCSRSDLTGIWRLYFSISTGISGVPAVVERCSFNMPSTGSAITSTSSCYSPNGLFSTSTRPLLGTLNIDSTCHVTGKLDFGFATNPQPIDAWISKDKDSISGISWDTSGGISFSFSGIKQ